jgi:hypothetical protein
MPKKAVRLPANDLSTVNQIGFAMRCELEKSSEMKNDYS